MHNKSRRAPGRRSQAESARTRARLLDRAERLFARKGYQGVALRELARSCGVHPFTVQHHFGTKLALYQEVLCRWDGEVLDRVARALRESRPVPELVEHIIGELFDFFLAKRDWMALNARAALGEGLPRGAALEDRSWVSFMNAAMRGGRLDAPFDTALLLITVEGILNHHVLSATRYRLLFGRDLSDPRLKARTVAHLKRVILALLRAPASQATRVRRHRGTRLTRADE
jgi:AcrR family transcriptional regulator